MKLNPNLGFTLFSPISSIIFMLHCRSRSLSYYVSVPIWYHCLSKKIPLFNH
ncbi:hypothetical protein QR98_0061300 [Sarcoptes scabiei]|uniref:Uncharacterized protein n=1 Tax=Sarcoptes scabiei TaxID=52283 RepID=A0A132A9F8_SARSC|nr:hypothetical protein QR98_0061300 [Sarcoptes scabiei]